MAEKNDQKMRERAERAEKFQAKLQELLALAKKKKNMLEYQEINDHFKDFAAECRSRLIKFWISWRQIMSMSFVLQTMMTIS